MRNRLLIIAGILSIWMPAFAAESHRTITFKNTCQQTIWFGSITGSAPAKKILSGNDIDCTKSDAGKQACISAGGACYPRISAPDACFSQTCQQNSDCMQGASCYRLTGKCFWLNPIPTNQSFKLAPGSVNTLDIPEYKANNIGIIWSGAFGGRTGCTAGGCLTALCTTGLENAEGACSLGVGFQQPATQSEVTFLTYPTGLKSVGASDAYDVTVINGVNLPMAMYPTDEPLPTSGNPYTCGAAGYHQAIPINKPAGNTIGASSWQIYANQSSLAYRYVVPQTTQLTRCDADTDCPTNQYCGLTYFQQSIGSTAKPGAGYLVCGTFAGWLTADQICGTNNFFTHALNKKDVSVKNFQCNFPITLGTMSNLYQCNGNYAVSGYSSASINACGCVNWHNQGINIQVPANTDYVGACAGNNPTWTGVFSSLNQPQVYDKILFLKQSCPSCYTYPFDDKSASFTCSNGNATTNNTENYTIEFCPGGHGNTLFGPPVHK